MSGEAITSFRGRHLFLSNFFLATIEHDGFIYVSCEHAYQAAKCLSEETRLFIQLAKSPGQAKRRGRTVALRPDWEENKLRIMEEIVEKKFATYSVLRAGLLRTGRREIIEGNDWGDRFWGQMNGVGENHLGKILMKVRKRLRQ